ARTDGAGRFGLTMPTGTTALATWTLAVVVVLTGLYVASARLTARVGSDALRTVRTGLLDGYLRASSSDQRAVHDGELPELVMTNAQQVATGTQQAASGITAVLNLTVLVVAAVALSWWSVIGLAGILALTVLVTRPSRALVRRLATRSASSSAAVTRSVSETVALAGELRAFDATDTAMDELARVVDTNASDAQAMQFAARAVPSLTRAATIGLLVVMVAAVTSGDTISVTELGAVILLLLRALGQAQVISATANLLTQRTTNLTRVTRALDRWGASAPVTGTVDCGRIGEIVLEDVSYRYDPVTNGPAVLVAHSPGAPLVGPSGGAVRAPALDGIDLRIGRGDHLGVVGRTGAGKSTLAGILLGLLRPTAGRVLVDGVPLTDLHPSTFYRRVGWVPQEPRLLTGTVADNIRFFRPSLDDRCLATAAACAGLGRELAEWPEGLDRPVGPGGAALSGGQRQRVTLARALAGDPDLIVLDEPTSAIDAESEALVRASLAALRGRVTVVVIAHRASTLDGCDRVLVVDRGRLVDGAGVGSPLCHTRADERPAIPLPRRP
ncbi:MAG: ABC transporter ATP-binding protein, partial [Ilumatobacteraceae bacterium]